MRLLASLFAVFWGFFFYGLIDLLVVVGDDPGFHDSVMLETGWGLMFIFLVATPLIAAAVWPRAALAVGLQQVVLVVVAVAVATVLSASPQHLIMAGGLLVTVLIIGSGDAHSLLVPRRLRWSWEPGALVIAAAVPWCIYASTSASAHRHGRLPIDETWGFNHWPVQAALAVAMVLVAALAATFPPGWVVPTWCVGVHANAARFSTRMRCRRPRPIMTIGTSAVLRLLSLRLRAVSRDPIWQRGPTRAVRPWWRRTRASNASQPAMALGNRRMPLKSRRPTHVGSSLKRVIEISAGNEAHHASPSSAPKYRVALARYSGAMPSTWSTSTVPRRRSAANGQSTPWIVTATGAP